MYGKPMYVLVLERKLDRLIELTEKLVELNEECKPKVINRVRGKPIGSHNLDDPTVWVDDKEAEEESK